MCGRYVFDPGDHFFTRWDITSRSQTLKPSYNVTPGMIMPVITNTGRMHFNEMKWGLISYWSKDPKIGFKTINARSEDLTIRPAFRQPFKNQRCLIPATGFYEWGIINGEKQPYFFKLKSGDIFAFAGLYDTWKDAEGFLQKTFTIITTAANQVVSPIHDRMPVILTRSDEAIWSDNSKFDLPHLSTLLKPLENNLLTGYPVSRAVNGFRSADTENFIKPLQNL